MEEIERQKMTRTKKTNGSEVHQVMTALTGTTIRSIVRLAIANLTILLIVVPVNAVIT